jgi:hypothetical protein
MLRYLWAVWHEVKTILWVASLLFVGIVLTLEDILFDFHLNTSGSSDDDIFSFDDDFSWRFSS